MSHPDKVLSEVTVKEEKRLPSVNHQDSAEQTETILEMLSGKSEHSRAGIQLLALLWPHRCI